MAEQLFPYSYYSCPCVDVSAPLPILSASRKPPREQSSTAQDDVEEDRQTFDPRSPRANLSLVPLEYLLWCTECHEMRCSRCLLEEVVCWYCPTCLFEVPSSTVRSEGNRCTRNCYNCPICTSPLTVNPLDSQPQDPKSDTPSGPFILMCGWCHWSSLDIGITFEKPNNLTAQLNKIKLSRRKKLTAETAEKGDDSTEEEPPDQEDENDIAKAAQRVSDPEELFLRLSTFYRQQVTESSDSPFPGGYTSSDMAFSSPSTISRLLNMYSGKRTKRLKPKPMREALTSEEGLLLVDEASEQAVIERQFEEGFSGTTDTSQRAFQPGGSPRFVSDLWPVASLLRTKRQKRCKTCRTLLVKPEARMTSSRWRIRLLALNHIPKINLRALTAPAVIGPYLGQPQAPGVSFEYETLQTGKTYQFLLTAVNPLFDPINVTLATATTTPGRVGSRITILCPQFTVGANSDVWDEALGGASKRRSVMPGAMQPAAIGEDDSQKQVEAGNVWRKGRNWASVIMEVVPGMLPAKDELEEDEDLLEIAVFVHIEYETAAAGDDKQVGVSINAPKEKRETAFWSVLGAGRIRNS